MKQRIARRLLGPLLAFCLASAAFGAQPSAAAAGVYVNGFSDPEELEQFTVSGPAEVYVNSGMLKMHAPEGLSETTVSRPLAEAFTEGVLEVRLLTGGTGNVKNLFLNSKGTPLLVLDNGNTTSNPDQTGILASTASGKVQLRAPSGGSAYTPMQWHHLGVVVRGGTFDAYFDGEKLNASPLSLPEGEIRALKLGARTWGREVLLWDDLRAEPNAELRLAGTEVPEPQKVRLIFSGPVKADTLSGITLSREGGGVSCTVSRQPDLRTVILSVPAGLRREAYTITYTGVGGVYGGQCSGSVQFTPEVEAEPEAKFVDELDGIQEGVNHVVSYTKNPNGSPAFYFDREPAENYCGDATRIFLNSNSGPSEIVYGLPDGIRSFRIVTFEAERTAPPRYELDAAVSGDGTDYQPLGLQRQLCDLTPSNTTFRMYEYTGRITGEGARFFKLILRRAEGDPATASVWTPKVARVELNCLTPPSARLISVSPAPEEELLPDEPILLTYDRELDEATLEGSFTLDGEAAAAELSADRRTVSLTGGRLSAGTAHTLQVLPSLRTADGMDCERTERTIQTAALGGVRFLDENGQRLDALPESGAVTPEVRIRGGQPVFAAVLYQEGEEVKAIHTAQVSGRYSFPAVPVRGSGRMKVLFWDSPGTIRPVTDPVLFDRDGTGTVPLGAGALEDSFETMSLAFSYSGRIRIASESPAGFHGDTARLAADRGGAVTYRLPADLKGIRLLAYLPREGTGAVSCEVSEDNRSYRPLSGAGERIDRPSAHTMQGYEWYDGIPAATRYLRISLSGGAQLGNLELFYGDYDLAQVESLQKELGYDHNEAAVRYPTAPELQELVRRKSGSSHPRLMADQSDFDRVKANRAAEPYASWLASLQSYANGLGNSGSYRPVPFVQTEVESEKKDFLTDIREMKRRVETLALLWQVTGNAAYAEWCWQELESMCDFPTLYPEHFLNVGEGALTLAVGYDWLYPYLSDARRQTLEDGVIRLCISEALPYMRGGYGFVNNTNNWNSVCNGGIGVAALCFADRRGDCAEAAAYAVKYCVRGFYAFAPDGSYPEGPGYWDFGTEYAVYWMCALQTAAGDDFGLPALTGLRTTGQFPLYTTSPIGRTFNFADGGDGLLAAPQRFWLAKQYEMPAYAWDEMSTPQPQAYDLLWYDPGCVQSPEEAGLPLNQYLGGEEDVAVLRQNWTSPDALYAALKGGDNQSSHGDLDIGAFILDAMGVRWAEELGAGYYHSDGYWDMGEDAGRWTYYRKRAEGHNTLVLNPGLGPDQNVFAAAQISGVTATEDGASAQLDMTPAYAGSARSAVRRLTTFHDSTEVLIQDWVEAAEPADLYWFFHTPAGISISEDGRTATLSQKGKTMQVKLVLPENAVFTAENAAALAESPHPDGDLKGHKKLSIHLANCTGARIAVVCTPIWDETYENTPLPDSLTANPAEAKK